MKLNSELRKEARLRLTGNWSTGVLLSLLYFVLVGAISRIPKVALVGEIVVLPILMWGMAIVFLRLLREGTTELPRLFDGFADFARVWGTMMLGALYVLLWSLLLFVPGIIKVYSYSLTPYILKDEPEMQYNSAIEKSMAMMEGNRMKLLLLDLSFLGWFLLSVLTAGIGLLFLIPYFCTSRAAFYEDLKATPK